MRRMIDPKELGGGGNPTPEMHCYMVVVNLDLHYIVYTTKNYAFKIGDEPKLIEDFATNNEYEELRAVGSYEAAGVGKNSNNENEEIVANYFTITSTKSYIVAGYNITTHKHAAYSLILSKTNWKVSKIF